MSQISLAYMAPSLTPHDGLNPGYRVYLTDSSDPEATPAAARMPPGLCSHRMASDGPPMSLGWASDGRRMGLG